MRRAFRERQHDGGLHISHPFSLKIVFLRIALTARDEAIWQRPQRKNKSAAAAARQPFRDGARASLCPSIIMRKPACFNSYRSSSCGSFPAV